MSFMPAFAQLSNQQKQKISSQVIRYIPTVLKPALSLVPFKVQEKLLMPILYSVFKEPIEDGDFDFLTNKCLAIHITDLGLTWLLSYQEGALVMLAPQTAQPIDVSFSAAGDDLVLIAGRKEDPDTLFFQRRLKIEGDTELGLAVKNLIDAIDLAQLPSISHYWVDKTAYWLHQYKSST